jgi:hypothetical protein
MAGVHNELAEAKLRLGIRTKMDAQQPVKSAAPVERTTLREVG